MCGVIGYVKLKKRTAVEDVAALNALSHRGPDQWGEWADERVYIGHRRLSILDLSERGRQPMTDEKESVIIAANGEIYNYPVLRKELEAKHEFQSHSDSEILIHGYKEWGLQGLLDRIDGMYAFCLYDRNLRKIHLVRDRAGIKPLYYFHVPGELVWASELKAIKAWAGTDRLKVDGTALYDFLTYLYIPAPKSLYRDVYKLEPGHVATFDLDRGHLEKHAYWQLEVREQKITVPDAEETLRTLIGRSVREQLMSDVPVGIFLSGGLDSGTVAEAASRFSRHIQTFTIKVDDPGHDESAYAEAMAKALETDHHVRLCRAEDADALIDQMPDWYDEPFADSSAIPTHLVSKFSRERIIVALSGDGGDELFGGYRWYSAMKDRSIRHRNGLEALRPLTKTFKRWAGRSLPGRAVRRFEFDYVLNDLEYYTRLMGGLLGEDKRRYARKFGIDDDYDDYWYFRKYWRDDLPLMTRLQYLDFHTYLPDDILTKVDRASMQVALEVRVPLLSRELIEFCFSLPEDVRYAGGQLKGLLKMAYRDRLPAEILQKPKQGFGLPVRAWHIADGSRLSLQELILKTNYADHAAGFSEIRS